MDGGAAGDDEPSGRRRPPTWAIGLLVLLLLGGLGVRLRDLDTATLAFHPARQLNSAIVARAMYADLGGGREADRAEAARAGRAEERFETPINQRVVSTLWLATGERLWVATVWMSVVWLAGAVAVFQILGRFTSVVGQLAGTAIQVFAPLAVEGGRAFQPDPLMVVLVATTALCALRWDEAPTDRRAVALGCVGGLAVLAKAMALPAVALLVVGFAVHRRGWVGAVRAPQSWLTGALLLVPTVVATALGWAPWLGGRSDDYFIADMLTTGDFYEAWWWMARAAVGTVVLLVGLVGIGVARGRGRLLGLLLLGGYVAATVAFDYRASSHNYYHLLLITPVAIGFGMAVGAALDGLRARELKVAEAVATGALAIGIVAMAGWVWSGIHTISGPRDPREPIRTAAALVPDDAKVLGVTTGYGRELTYFGRLEVVGELPSTLDRRLLELQGKPVPSVQESVEASGADFLVISAPGKLLGDPETANELDRLYRLVDYGPGWIVFDLREVR